MQVAERVGMTVELQADFETSLNMVTEALKSEGFGVLTEIDVKETLKQKLGVDFRPYRILGACNPPLAHRALSANSEAGLLLPCNVTVAHVEDNITEVSIINPDVMMSVAADPGLGPIAAEAKEKLDRVVATLEAGLK